MAAEVSEFGSKDLGQSEPPGQTPREDSPTSGKTINTAHVVSVKVGEDPGVVYKNEQHSSLVMAMLKTQQEKGLFCDTRLLVNHTVELKAHRCVLAATSSYISGILTGDNPPDAISLSANNIQSIESILEYMYSGQLSVSIAIAEELLAIADKLAMSDVRQCCLLHLEKNLDITNWSDTLLLAEQCMLSDLCAAVKTFATENFIFICHSEQILELPLTMLESIIRNCNTSMDPDVELYALGVVLRWIVHKKASRSSAFHQLLGLIRPDILSKEGMDSTLQRPEIQNSDLVQDPLLGDLVNSVYERVKQEQIALAEKRAEDTKSEMVSREADGNDLTDTIPEVKKEVMDSEETPGMEERQENECKAVATTTNSSDMNTEGPREKLSDQSLKQEIDQDFTHHDFDGVEEGGGSNADTAIYGSDEDVEAQETTTEDVKNIEMLDIGTSPEHEVGNVMVVQPEAPDPNSSTGRSRRKASMPIKRSYYPDDEEEMLPQDPPVKRKRGRPPRVRTGDEPATRVRIRIKPAKKKRLKSFGTQTFEDTIDAILDDDENKDSIVGPDGEVAVPKRKSKKGRGKNKRKSYRIEENGRYKCPKCPKDYPCTQSLEKHIRGHGQEVPFLCDICGFTTRHVNSIRLHKLRHNGNKFKCTFPGCKYENIRKSRLDDHMSAHEGIKNHVCSQCGKAFAGRKHMQRHEKIHVEVKPICCEQCDWKTTRRDKLRDHIRKHHSNWAIMTGFATVAEVEKAKLPEPPRPPKDRTNRKRKSLVAQQIIKKEGSVLKTERGDKEIEAASNAIDEGRSEARTIVVPTHLQGATSTIGEEMLTYLSNMEVEGPSQTVAAMATGQQPHQPGPSIAIMGNPVAVQQQEGVLYSLYMHPTGPQQFP